MKTSSQLLKDCDELKQKLADSGSPLNNNEVWSLQHQFQVTCGQLLVEYQDFALEKGIERELWNVGFRNNINLFQSEVQSKKKESSEAKDVLNWFLSSASGFYLQLFNQICSFNSLDLVFRRKDSFYGMLGGGLSTLPEASIKKANMKNALYLCQYCLIHLGDLARYRHHAKQSETFYRHAVTVSATSGHPYNQLALLEAGRGNRLAAVFLYIRSLCVAAPFTGAPSNLAQTLSKILTGRNKDEITSSEIKMGTLTRMTKEEYVNLFLHFHSCLLLKGDLDAAKEGLPRLTSALSTLVATTALTRSSLVHMFTINLFSMLYFSGRLNLRVGDEMISKKDEDLFVDYKSCSECLPLLDDLMIGMLAALLLPIHTMKDPEVVMTFTALPAVRLNLEWILIEGKLSCSALKKKQQIWPGLCALVNFLQQPLQNFDCKTYEEVPLPEDWDLQGFQPLSKFLSRYRFRESVPKLMPEDYGLLRAHRLTELAQKFSKDDLEGGPLIKKCPESDGQNIKFEAQGQQNPPEEDVLNLERLTLQPPLIEKTSPNGSSGKKEKKVGILKPEGSLERAKEAKETKEPLAISVASAKAPIKGIITPMNKEIHPKKDKRKTVKPLPEDKKVGLASVTVPVSISGLTDSLIVPSARPKTRTNVALQAILKRNSNTQEMKQVTFQAISPTTSPNPSDASNESQRSQMSTPPLMAIQNHSLDVKPPSPLQNLPFSSHISSSSSQPATIDISKPPPNVAIPLNQPPPTYRWQEGPPPPLLQLTSSHSGSFGTSNQSLSVEEPPHIGIQAVQNHGTKIGLQQMASTDQSLAGRYSNLDLRNQPPVSNALSSNPTYRMPQSGNFYAADLKFKSKDTSLPLFGNRFTSPQGSSWERQSSGTDLDPQGTPGGESFIHSVLPNNTPIQHHGLTNRQPGMEGQYKDVAKYSEQQPQNSMSHQLKSSLLTNPYQIQVGTQSSHFSHGQDASVVSASSLIPVQRTSPMNNSSYLESTQIANQKPRANSNFPTSTGSLFAQSSAMNEGQQLSSHSSNFFPGVPSTGGGWWQSDSSTRLPSTQDFPQLMTATLPHSRNISGSSVEIPMRPIPQQGILAQYQQNTNMPSGATSSALYSTAPSDQNPQEVSESGGARGSSTYSLFGPLGGIDSPNQPLPQHLLFPSTQQRLQQNLWSGPSPLERLLEQKKYASGK